MHTDRSSGPGGLRLPSIWPGAASRELTAGLSRLHWRWYVRIGLALLLVGSTAGVAVGLTQSRLPDSGERALVARLHPSDIEHAAQDGNDCLRTRPPNGNCSGPLNNLSNNFGTGVNGGSSARFDEAFELGDELFSHVFSAAEGGGANVGRGERYTRMPRADLNGFGEWANHTPSRATGPNAASCDACHFEGGADGAGVAANNVHRDPRHSGDPKQMIQRSTPHLLGLAGLQLTAEEITEELFSDRDGARNAACQVGGTQTRNLTAKGIGFGSISATRTVASPCTVTFNTSGVRGVAADLVVRPFQWKGTVNTVRDFVRGAMHNENGVQAVEMAGDGVDGDFDGVDDELTIGDITALAVYMSFQPRPTTLQELSGITNPATGQPFVTLSTAQNNSINNGRTVFGDVVHCDSCHVPSVTLNGRIWQEPSDNPNYRDATFPAGQSPTSRGVSPTGGPTGGPIRVDITRNGPDNRNVIPGTNGDVLGSFRRSGNGATVSAFTDYRRHNLGFEVAEQIDEEGTGASTFMTRALWGVGSTGPYMHNGAATTLTEAILLHGGEASNSRSAFLALSGSSTGRQQQVDLIAYLNEHVLLTQEE